MTADTKAENKLASDLKKSIDKPNLINENTREILRACLQLDERADELEDDSLLLGEIPELDSMAVAMIITAIEEEFDIIIEADEIDGETFETFGSLCLFIAEKLESTHP